MSEQIHEIKITRKELIQLINKMTTDCTTGELADAILNHGKIKTADGWAEQDAWLWDIIGDRMGPAGRANTFPAEKTAHMFISPHKALDALIAKMEPVEKDWNYETAKEHPADPNAGKWVLYDPLSPRYLTWKGKNGWKHSLSDVTAFDEKPEEKFERKGIPLSEARKIEAERMRKEGGK